MIHNRPGMDEKQAVARLKHNDPAGLEALVRLYQVKAVYAAYLIVRDRSLAEDVVQAAFLRAYERIGQFDETRPFGPWFLRSVVNGAIDAARQLDRMISLDQEDETGQPSGWLAADSPCPEDFVETAETRQAVRCALDQLTAEQRAAIVLRHFLDMSENEMTLHLQRPPSTIKWRLHEARKRLRALLRVFWLVESQDQQEE